MTTPEHTLVGIHLAFALPARFSTWRIVAVSGIASNLPDWDGLPMLIDMAKFESGHRVWGHNVVSIVLLALLLAWTQWRYDWLRGIGDRFQKSPLSQAGSPQTASQFGKRSSFLTLAMIAVLAQTVHLVCDMVVSGGEGLTDWPIRPWWPFSDASYVWPLIPWGDVGAFVVLILGAILMAKLPNHSSRLSRSTLVALCVYLVCRGWMRGTLV